MLADDDDLDLPTINFEDGGLREQPEGVHAYPADMDDGGSLFADGGLGERPEGGRADPDMNNVGSLVAPSEPSEDGGLDERPEDVRADDDMDHVAELCTPSDDDVNFDQPMINVVDGGLSAQPEDVSAAPADVEDDGSGRHDHDQDEGRPKPNVSGISKNRTVLEHHYVASLARAGRTGQRNPDDVVRQCHEIVDMIAKPGILKRSKLKGMAFSNMTPRDRRRWLVRTKKKADSETAGALYGQ